MYNFLPKRLSNFFRYVNKVYGFSKILNSIKDKRHDTEITPKTIFLSVFLCCLLRFGSLNRLEFEAKNKRLSKFLKTNKGEDKGEDKGDKYTFCANSIANGLENIDTDILEHQLISIPKKMKRNKVFCVSIGGLKIASVDGTEIYRSDKIYCNECLEYHIKTKEGIRIDYVHRIVLMQMVGKIDSSYVQTILGMEKILPKDILGDTSEEGHEGETTSAKRLILKMIERYGKFFFDVLTTDALYTIYTNAPFVRFLYEQGKYLVSRVNNERTDLYKEIESLSELVRPVVINDWQEQVECWIYEVPYLSEWLAKDIPTRGFKIIEKSYKEESGRRIYTNEEVFRCVTTLPEDKADGNVIRQIVHSKWGIENNGFKDLKDNWFLTHNYHHHPNAIEALLLILFTAYNLFYSYVYRHMKTYRLYGLTMRQILEEMMISYIIQERWMSWSTFDG